MKSGEIKSGIGDDLIFSDDEKEGNILSDQDWKNILTIFQDDNSSSSSSRSLLVFPTLNRNEKKENTATQKRRKRKLIDDSLQTSKISPSTRSSGYIRSLHVWKKDIRRKYVDMYLNVINHHDAWLFSHFLQEFAHPMNCQFTITMPSSPNIPVTLCTGISNVVYGLTQIHLKLPDCVHQLSDIAIHVPHHTPGSRIVSKMIFQGTRLFEFHNDALAEAVHSEAAKVNSEEVVSQVVIDEDKESISSTTTNTPTSTTVAVTNRQAVTGFNELLPALSFEELRCNQKSLRQHTSFDAGMEADLMNRFQSLQLYHLSIPKEVRLEGTLTLSLTPSHQIDGIHFQVNRVSEKDLSSFS